MQKQSKELQAELAGVLSELKRVLTLAEKYQAHRNQLQADIDAEQRGRLELRQRFGGPQKRSPGKLLVPLLFSVGLMVLLATLFYTAESSGDTRMGVTVFTILLAHIYSVIWGTRSCECEEHEKVI